MEYPRIREQYDATLESEGANRIVTAIEIADGVFADVMAIQECDAREIGLIYVMEETNGDTAHYSENGAPAGNIESYGFTERELTAIAESAIGRDRNGRIRTTV